MPAPIRACVSSFIGKKQTKQLLVKITWRPVSVTRTLGSGRIWPSAPAQPEGPPSGLRIPATASFLCFGLPDPLRGRWEDEVVGESVVSDMHRQGTGERGGREEWATEKGAGRQYLHYNHSNSFRQEIRLCLRYFDDNNVGGNLMTANSLCWSFRNLGCKQMCATSNSFLM